MAVVMSPIIIFYASDLGSAVCEYYDGYVIPWPAHETMLHKNFAFNLECDFSCCKNMVAMNRGMINL